jgi:hypothetical protein
VLVGHEVSFDLRFLTPEVRPVPRAPLTSRPVLDTRLRPALGDALTTAEIFVRLLVILRKRGASTLGDALEAVRGARTLTI